MSASMMGTPRAMRDLEDALFAERDIPRTFQPLAWKNDATEPPWRCQYLKGNEKEDRLLEFL
jgi:hypothetical protein